MGDTDGSSRTGDSCKVARAWDLSCKVQARAKIATQMLSFISRLFSGLDANFVAAGVDDDFEVSGFLLIYSLITKTKVDVYSIKKRSCSLTNGIIEADRVKLVVKSLPLLPYCSTVLSLIFADILVVVHLVQGLITCLTCDLRFC